MLLTPLRGLSYQVRQALLGSAPNAACQLVPKVALATIPRWLEKVISSHVSGTDIVAWWGATAGTIALGWNVLRHARSKGRMKLDGIYQLDRSKNLLPPGFAVRVTNVGSKPVLVQGLAIERKKGSDPSHYFFPCENPRMLARGKFFVQVIDPNGWLPTDVKRLYAWDSSGKHWYLGRKQFRWLIDQHRRLIEAESRRVERR